MTNLKDLAHQVAKPWDKSPYYQNAEKLTEVFWGENTIFLKFFNRLDLTSVTELACGHGRHSEIVQPKAGHLTLIDVFEDNLRTCQERMSQSKNVTYLLGNGYDFQPIKTGSQSAIFCYDAMVHFAPELVESYLKDAARILAPGGLALLHHSNFNPTQDQHYGLNPCARNAMTRTMFNAFADAASLELVEARKISWGGHEDLDGVSLLRAR